MTIGNARTDRKRDRAVYRAAGARYRAILYGPIPAAEAMHPPFEGQHHSPL